MASAVHQSRPNTPNTAFSAKGYRSTSAGISNSTRHYGASANSQIKGASRPSSPRLQHSHQPYSNQLRSTIAAVSNSDSTTTAAATTTVRTKRSASAGTSSLSPPLNTMTLPPPQPSYSSTLFKPSGHSLSSTSTPSFPHPSTHPPLRLLTSATCETYTCLVSARSPPHSPTFTAISLPRSISSGSGGSGSRANSILDGIQSALGGALGASSSPPTSTNSMKNSPSYSAAKESLADFSIAASKRNSTQSSNSLYSNSNANNEKSAPVVRSRSNYVSFPNFDEVDFVDVAMVEDTEADDEDDQWMGPDSPLDAHRAVMQSNGYSSMNEKLMRPVGTVGEQQQSMVDPRIGLGMPMSPSQHWLLQLETYHELRMNGAQV